MAGESKFACAVGAVLALGASHWYALDVGRDLGRAVCVQAASAQKDVVITTITQAVQDNAVEQKSNQAIARKVSDGVQDELVAVHDFQPAITGVRIPTLPAAGCSGAAGKAQAAGAGDADGTSAGAAVFPEEVQRAFDRFTEGAGRLEKEADAVTALARGHQEFVRRNGFYGEPVTEAK